VSYEQTETTYLIRVQDNGIGFDQKYAEKVFELFQRLDVTSVPGTGLGLAISRRIVERHGGRMWAESRPGLGSCFMFTLPNREEAP
jgi:signal transduction histidine kinase